MPHATTRPQPETLTSGVEVRGVDVSFGRPRRPRGAADTPLGSLTQSQHRHGRLCRQCGSERLTTLMMSLTDGTPVEFVSCHRCECRVWEHDGTVMDVATVLQRTRKVA